MGPRAGLDGCGRCRSYGDSIPGRSSPCVRCVVLINVTYVVALNLLLGLFPFNEETCN